MKRLVLGALTAPFLFTATGCPKGTCECNLTGTCDYTPKPGAD